ncbi:hypothetical protein PsorP6_005370 [Peronosclerospora sorghi]|uniref:Uncharacterized protein n=1 Tax=Peronosclerospora sorghi TaxID=230839 RepID=A0ACC0W1E9_9STRA|nr:hypothetical protein PsorP6_005370 [Peronosclerospora sorghi]
MACFQDVDVPSIMQDTDEWVPQMARKLKARIHGVNAHHNIKESEVVKAGRCMFDTLATVCLRTQGSRRMRARCLWLSSENVAGFDPSYALKSAGRSITARKLIQLVSG